MENPSIALPAPQPIEHRYSYALQPWLVCFSAALFFFYEFIQLNMFNAISPQLEQVFQVHGTQFGYFSASFLIGDVLFLIPAGLILDRLSVKRVILLAMSLSIMSTFIFAHTSNLYLATLCHFISGTGNAFSFLSCMMLATRWFPSRRLALVVGLIVTFAMLGGMVSQTPLVMLTMKFGWRLALIFVCMLGMSIFLIIALVVKDHPSKNQSAVKKVARNSGLWPDLRTAMANKQNWLCGIFTSLLNLPILVLGANWGLIYLTQRYGLTNIEGSKITAMIFFGMIFGSPIFGWFSDFFARRRMPMIIGALLSVGLIFIIVLLQRPSGNLLTFLFFLLGFITASQVLSYPVIAESNPAANNGSAMALASFLIMGGGALGQPLFGWLLSLNWQHQFANGVPVYSHHDLNTAILLLPIAFCLSLICAFLVKETHCRNIFVNGKIKN
ncbi:MAG: MFS transporter [Pseudomonadota bacterium]